MNEPLDFTRSPGRRETAVVVAGVLAGPLVLITAWQLAESWRLGPTWISLVVTVLWLALVWVCAPFWQLLLAPAREGDVLLRVDAEGLLLRDAGYRVRVPWPSVGHLRIAPGARGWKLVPTVVGPVDRSWDPLARMVVRGLRRGSMVVRIDHDSPDLERLRDGVPRLSGGRVRLDEPV